MTTKNVTVSGIALMAKMKLVVENVKKLKLHVREDYFMKIQNVYQCHTFVMVSKVIADPLPLREELYVITCWDE